MGPAKQRAYFASACFVSVFALRRARLGLERVLAVHDSSGAHTGRADGPFTSKSSDGSVVFGSSAGRWSVGLFASGSRRGFSDGAYNDIALGVSVRVPFAAGIVCCAWPHSSNAATRDEDNARHTEEPRAQPRTHAPAEPKKSEPNEPPPSPSANHIPAQPRIRE